VNASSLRSRGHYSSEIEESFGLVCRKIHRGPNSNLGVVNVAVDQTKALKLAGGLSRTGRSWIADQLRIVRSIIDEDKKVGASREVDHSRSWLWLSCSLGRNDLLH